MLDDRSLFSLFGAARRGSALEALALRPSADRLAGHAGRTGIASFYDGEVAEIQRQFVRLRFPDGDQVLRLSAGKAVAPMQAAPETPMPAPTTDIGPDVRLRIERNLGAMLAEADNDWPAQRAAMLAMLTRVPALPAGVSVVGIDGIVEADFEQPDPADEGWTVDRSPLQQLADALAQNAPLGLWVDGDSHQDRRYIMPDDDASTLPEPASPASETGSEPLP